VTKGTMEIAMTSPTEPLTEDEFTVYDLEKIEREAARVRNADHNRYVTVMAEIQQEEDKLLERLKEVRIRRQIVQKAGHL
jgi:hypothetical protein